MLLSWSRPRSPPGHGTLGLLLDRRTRSQNEIVRFNVRLCMNVGHVPVPCVPCVLCVFWVN
uniref:LD41365p n=1 Tax=Drosophila melanogaster TaxID=7227 RepID=Q8SX62_DROME|nr:LD41365p [Drosophila melanogaster]